MNHSEILDAAHRATLAQDWPALNALLKANPAALTKDDTDWCTRCGAHTAWIGAPLKCTGCGWLNRWTPREPLSKFGGPEVDRTTSGARLRPGG